MNSCEKVIFHLAIYSYNYIQISITFLKHETRIFLGKVVFLFKILVAAHQASEAINYLYINKWEKLCETYMNHHIENHILWYTQTGRWEMKLFHAIYFNVVNYIQNFLTIKQLSYITFSKFIFINISSGGYNKYWWDRKNNGTEVIPTFIY